MAHLIGNNLRNNPEDLLRPPDTALLWDRMLAGSDDLKSQAVSQRRIVLRQLSLYKRFGCYKQVLIEAQWIAKKIEEEDPNITWSKFLEIIKDLKDRKILQGEYNLYISPGLFHIKLWLDWWEIYGNTFVLDEFTQGIPPVLLEWFYDMFIYAGESRVASGIVKKLLGQGGPFYKDQYLEKRMGAGFFLTLAKADPLSALQFLKETVGTWDKKHLLRFDTGRRETVWALEHIARFQELFTDAAKILSVLAVAENENFSNNSSGVFIGLFSLGPGKVAPTAASPKERLPVIQELLVSEVKEKRLIALKACNAALKIRSFSR
ncbi:MAG: hypothetical protein KAQ85_02050, partial [Thermodesulfovibrionia bacterium]|nr:hypothetical protein [Thermodesulfovibrionia bacterium]